MPFYEKSWFLWLQFGYLLWLIVRPAAFFRLPWCLITHCLRKLLSLCSAAAAPEIDVRASIFLLPGLKHTVQPQDYLDGSPSYSELMNKHVTQVEGDSYIIKALGRCVVVGMKDLDNVCCLFCCEMNKQQFVSEALDVNGFVNVIRLCTFDAALTTYFRTKFFCIRRKVSINFIEHSPLGKTQHWIGGVIATLPLLLQARGLALSSALVTIAIYVLDLFSNYITDLCIWTWAWTLRCVKLMGNPFSFTAKLIFYSFLSNFDPNFMPGGVVHLTMTRSQVQEFLFVENSLLTAHVHVIEPVLVQTPLEISPATVNVEINVGEYRIVSEFKNYDKGFLSVLVKVRGVVFDKVEHLYNCPVNSFFMFIEFLRYLNSSTTPGLVVAIQRGWLGDKLVCLGIQDTINAFWEPGFKMFKGEFKTRRWCLLGDIAAA